MPTLTNHQVFYIINPSNGETVAPWDATNKYMDTELCQEGILGLTPTPGVPCTTLPTGNDWYTVIDNSDDSSEPWNLPTPLDTKWIRVTLKGNNMTPVVASGVPAMRRRPAGTVRSRFSCPMAMVRTVDPMVRSSGWW